MYPEFLLKVHQNFDKSSYMECEYAKDLIELFFEMDQPPCFFVGDINKANYGLIGLNPGYKKKENIIEKRLYKELGWEKLYTNFFKYYRDTIRGTSPYFRQFSIILAGILGKKEILDLDDRKKSLNLTYKLLHENLVNFDLIPYHSKVFNIGLIKNKMNILKPYLDVTKQLIENSSIKYLFIVGKTWKLFLDEQILKNELHYSNAIILNPNADKNKIVKAIPGECLDRKLIYFDKFFTSYFGITYEQLYNAGKKMARISNFSSSVMI